MKNKSKFLSVTAVILMTIFAVAIAVATFVENKHDTQTAKDMIYHARWMQILLFLMGINLLASIVVDKLYLKGKLTGMIFHFAFVLMLIGAGLTFYKGEEGTMHIREGESSNVIFSSGTYFRVIPSVETPDVVFDFETKKDLYPITVNDNEGNEIEIKFKEYINNAVDRIVENSPDGNDMVELTVAGSSGNVGGFVYDGQIKQIGQLKFAFNNDSDSTAIQIINENNELKIKAMSDIYRSKMGGVAEDTVEYGEYGDFFPNNVYALGEDIFFFNGFYKKAKTHLTQGEPGNGFADAVIADLLYKGQTKEINIFGGSGYVTTMQEYQIGDKKIMIGYGNVPIELPFSIYLKDFVMERYPGSNSPSSFESDVILIDNRENLKMDYKIFMNNILDHDGYRFFQSSYDPDERGTVLSVNHDRAGTIVTYLSYILLVIGFIGTFFNKKSRFRALSKRLANTGINGKAAILLLLVLGLGVSSSAQTNLNRPVDKDHANKFGSLIVQTFDGRFEPVHTLANDVVMKISKRSSINDELKGKMNAVQLYMDFIIDSEYWKNKPVIFIKNDDIKYLIGVNGKYASFKSFFDQQGNYKLSQQTEIAYKKSKAEKTDFDQEIIKVNERLNILLMTFRGGMLKIFPEQNSHNHKWVSLDDSAAYSPLKGSINAINEDLQLPSLTYSNILRLYFNHVSEAVVSGNYSRADQILGYMNNIQRQIGSEDVLPSESMIKLEIHYNKAQIFTLLKFIYMILSVFMLILAFADHLRAKKSNLIKWGLNIMIALLAFAFLYHTYGLVLRWYLSGHAPWSNGYEALIFVAWGGLLAGFIFMKYSKITLAATALLAFLITLVAGFSTYDPQLTNLQPVLKSYWLIIHVAVIVISYGFLGLGFILGLINLFSYVFMNSKNSKKLNMSIKELSNINEMTLIIGIFLATAGTFLGAVWANESWGRYWGWDAKETWALIILMVYAVVLHLRLIPSLNNIFVFNTASVIGFGSVIMTFFGVNYYFTKGLHSYASGDKAVFPTWAWIAVILLIFIIFTAYMKSKKYPEKILSAEKKED